MLENDLAAAITAYTLCIVGMWVRHGGVAALGDGWEQTWTSLSRLSGLVTSGLALVGVVIAGRPHFLERTYGLDRLYVWHRVIGDAVGVLLAVHVATGTAGWIVHSGVSTTFGDFTGGEPYMGLATLGGALAGIVVISSLRSLRRRLAYEAWYFIHLGIYLAFAISYGHQIVLGTDLAEDRVARWFWAGAHALAIGAVLWGRWGRLATAWFRPLYVHRCVEVADRVVALHLRGPRLASMRAVSGQFFLLRPLRRGQWWKAHPYSLSAAPTTAGLRFTVKDRGEGSAGIMTLPRGTKVVVEGPFGATTSALLHERRPLFVVGGVGVTPVRAMLEDLAVDSHPVVLYRARKPSDLVHLDEIEHLAQRTGGEVLTLVGPTATLAGRDPFSPSRLRSLVPDLTERVAVLCGPERLVHAARSGLRAAGVPAEQIHYERAWW